MTAGCNGRSPTLNHSNPLVSHPKDPPALLQISGLFLFDKILYLGKLSLIHKNMSTSWLIKRAKADYLYALGQTSWVFTYGVFHLTDIPPLATVFGHLNITALFQEIGEVSGIFIYPHFNLR